MRALSSLSSRAAFFMAAAESESVLLREASSEGGMESDGAMEDVSEGVGDLKPDRKLRPPYFFGADRDPSKSPELRGAAS